MKKIIIFLTLLSIITSCKKKIITKSTKWMVTYTIIGTGGYNYSYPDGNGGGGHAGKTATDKNTFSMSYSSAQGQNGSPGLASLSACSDTLGSNGNYIRVNNIPITVEIDISPAPSGTNGIFKATGLGWQKVQYQFNE